MPLHRVENEVTLVKEPHLDEFISEMRDKMEILERRNGELLEEMRRV